MPVSREWTNAELLVAAMSSGFAATQRLLDDWTSIGLLDSVQRRKTGKGQDPGVRSNHQHDLWLTLLGQRHNVTQIAALTNVPVYAWLAWGDDCVPLRQTRKALHTYASTYSTASAAKAKVAALEHIRAFGLHKVPTRVRLDLELAISEAIAREQPNLDEFRDRIEAALRALLTERRTRLILPSIDNLLWIIDLRLRGLAPFRDGTDVQVFDDQVMERARDLHRQNSAGYAQASRLTIKQLNTELVNNACINLVTELARLTGDTPVPPASPAALHQTAR